MLIIGLRAIGRYMKLSPPTILRLHKKYNDPSLCFPLIPRPTGRGWGIEYITDTDLILIWLDRLAQANAKRPHDFRLGAGRPGTIRGKGKLRG